MHLLGLPNETLEHDDVFGDILVSLVSEGLSLPVVTTIWETSLNRDDKKVLYTVLSIEYNARIMPDRARHRWLFRLLAEPRPNKDMLRGDCYELLAAQALAYDQVERIRKKQTHERHIRSNNPGLGTEGAAVCHSS